MLCPKTIKIMDCLLQNELSSRALPVPEKYNPNMSKNASWAHKPILIKSNITTILQLSPNNSIVDYTFIQTYINIYKSNTCYVQKPSKSWTAFFKMNCLLERSLYLKNIIPRQGELKPSSGITLNGLLST